MSRDSGNDARSKMIYSSTTFRRETIKAGAVLRRGAADSLVARESRRARPAAEKAEPKETIKKDDREEE